MTQIQSFEGGGSVQDIRNIGDKDWQRWRSSDELQTRESFYTDFPKYSGDGYIMDISMGISTQEFVNTIKAMFDNTHEDFKTKAGDKQ